jgi:ATP-dependent RNA helicase SUPV3L1/SUV3
VSKHNPQEDQTIAPLPAAPSAGLVTTLDEIDYKNLKYAMNMTPKPILTAGVLPSAMQIEEFAALFPPGKELSFILRKLHENMRTGRLFHICGVKAQAHTATFLEGISGLTVTEKLQFCIAPISRDPNVLEAAVEMAKCVANNSDGSILNIGALDLDVLDIENPKSMPILQRLESLHKSVLLWLWLS